MLGIRDESPKDTLLYLRSLATGGTVSHAKRQAIGQGALFGDDDATADEAGGSDVEDADDAAAEQEDAEDAECDEHEGEAFAVDASSLPGDIVATEAAGDAAPSPNADAGGAKRKPRKGFDCRLSVLLATRHGMGKRMRLADVGLRRKNQRGMRVIRLNGADVVVGACVVPDDEIPPVPRQPRLPYLLYNEEQERARIVVAAEAALATATEAVSGAETGFVEARISPDEASLHSVRMEGVTTDYAAGAVSNQRPTGETGLDVEVERARAEVADAEELERRFAALSEAERAPFLSRYASEQEAYEQAIKTRRERETVLLSKLGEVLICTDGGFMNRVRVATVPVHKKSHAGRPLMKIKTSDGVATMALITSEETVAGEPTSASRAAVSEERRDRDAENSGLVESTTGDNSVAQA